MSQPDPVVETEIIDAAAAAVEALDNANPNEESNATAGQHVPMHLPPAVHNPVQDPQQSTEADATQTKLEEEHRSESAEQLYHPQDMHDAVNIAFEALNASLHEPPVHFDPNEPESMLAAIKQLQHTQRQQTHLILTMRDMLHDVSINQSKLAECHEVSSDTTKPIAPKQSTWQKSPQSSGARMPPSTKYQTQLIAAQMQSLEHEPCSTTDEEIDAILDHKRSHNQSWPVHRLKKWIEEEDLHKIRMHRSLKYNHVPIRLPRTDKNKEGRLICKLCSGGKCNRNTTWMCSTCEVPLCIDTIDGDQTLTHHVLWHRSLDLRGEHERCNALLRERRLEKKRGAQSENGGQTKRERSENNMDDMMVREMHHGEEMQHHEEQHGNDAHHVPGMHHGEVHENDLNHDEIHHMDQHVPEPVHHVDAHHGETMANVEQMNVHVDV